MCLRHTIVYLQKLEENYRFLDSLYKQFSFAADRRYEVGETNYLEKLTARSKMREVAVRLAQTIESKNQAYVKLEHLIQLGSEFEIPDQELIPLPVTEWLAETHPRVLYYREAVQWKQDDLSLESTGLCLIFSGKFSEGQIPAQTPGSIQDYSWG